MSRDTNPLQHATEKWLDHRGETSGPSVLIADDSEADIFMLVRAFAASGVKNPVFVVRSGKECLDYLAGNGPFADRSRYPLPKIVFLDLKMPHPDGLHILRWKEQQNLKGILWVATSSFDGVRTINEAYASGATTFLTKPLDRLDIHNLIESFNQFWNLTPEGMQMGNELSIHTANLARP